MSSKKINRAKILLIGGMIHIILLLISHCIIYVLHQIFE